MIAVNGYDESKQEVQEFAEKEKLKHPILLMGSTVATDVYEIPGYPTSFWIDHEGRIVGREVGFDPAHASDMEKKLERHLGAREAALKK